MIRVVVAEDHTFVLRSIVWLLSGEQDIEVVGATESGAEALLLAEVRRPDVLLLDIGLPDRDGLAVGAAVRRGTRATGLVYLSMYDDDATIRAALRLRADGFVLKTDAIEEVCAAIRAAADGEHYYSSGVAEQVAAMTRHPVSVDLGGPRPMDDLALLRSVLADVVLDPVTASRTGLDVSPARLAELASAAEALADAQRRRRRPFEQLTPGERAVLAAIVDGMSAQAIACRRHVSVSTVRSQIRSVLQRLGVNSQLEAVALARRAQWPDGAGAGPDRQVSLSSRDDRP